MTVCQERNVLKSGQERRKVTEGSRQGDLKKCDKVNNRVRGHLFSGVEKRKPKKIKKKNWCVFIHYVKSVFEKNDVKIFKSCRPTKYKV